MIDLSYWKGVVINFFILISQKFNYQLLINH